MAVYSYREFNEAIRTYSASFDKRLNVTTMNIDPENLKQIANAMLAAVKRGSPLTTEEEARLDNYIPFEAVT